MGDLLKALDEFGFVDPVNGKKPEITLNKNFYPDPIADESKEKEQVEILEAELNKEQ